MTGSSEPGLKGQWRTTGSVLYKNKRDFDGQVRFVMIYEGINVLSISEMNDFIQTTHNAFDALSLFKCQVEASELGLIL